LKCSYHWQALPHNAKKSALPHTREVLPKGNDKEKIRKYNLEEN
jgi:hypothetical protein